jgi:hypothetical protein
MKLKINEDYAEQKISDNLSVAIFPNVIRLRTTLFSIYIHNTRIDFGQAISFTTEKFLDFLKHLEKEVLKYENE